MSKITDTQMERIKKEFELLWGEAPKGSLKEKKGAELLKLFETHLTQVEKKAYDKGFVDGMDDEFKRMEYWSKRFKDKFTK